MKANNLRDYLRVLPLCLISCLIFVAPAFAERPASGNGQAIRESVANVLGKTDILSQNLGNLCDLNCQGSDAGKVFKAKTDHIKQTQARAKNAIGRVSPADFERFNRRATKHKSDDGCDPEVEICVAGDSSPSPMVASAAEPQVDEERGKDAIEDLAEVAADVDQLNAVLAGNVPPPPPTVYQELENAEYFFPPSMWPSPKVQYAAFLANLAAEKAAAVADHFCDETIVALGAGGNGSAACAVTETIHQVLDAAYQIMEYIGNDITAAEVTGAYKRIGNVYYQLLGTGGDLNAVKQVVEAMGEKLLQIEENQKYIMQLLTTPQGQRSGFPGGTGAGGATLSGPSSTGPKPTSRSMKARTGTR